MSQLWAMKSQGQPTTVVLNGMYCSTGSCPLLGLCPRFDVLFSHNFYLNCINLGMPFSTACTFKLCLVKFLPQFYLHWLICFIKYIMQCTFLILKYAFSVITHKQSDKLATIQGIKCHAYDRDGADCSFSQDLKISTCQRIYIYYLWLQSAIVRDGRALWLGWASGPIPAAMPG